MTKPENLTPSEWSKVLQSDKREDIRQVAATVSSGYNMPWVDQVLIHTGDCEEVLDLGAGRGELAATLALHGKTMSMLDWAENNVAFEKALFQELGLKGNFQQADMTKTLPYKDGQFEAVYSCGVFEYFSDDVIKSILKEAFRIARKRVIIMVPNSWSLAYRFGKWNLERKGQWVWGGEHPFSTLKPHFRAATKGKLVEFSVGTRHSLDFLTMRGGQKIQKALKGIFQIHDHSKPSRLNQGYLLITVGEKV